MLNNLLDIVPKEDGNWYFDNFGEAALYALIGFVVVFVGIILIIGIIWLVGLIMRKSNNLEFLTKKRVKKNKKSATQQADTQTATEDEIPDEVKAAIVAAIMAYYQEKEEKCSFTVKRIKRI